MAWTAWPIAGLNSHRRVVPAPPSLQIRLATLSDVDGLLSLHYRVFDASTHHALLLGQSFMRSAYQWFCRTDRGFVLVAEQGRQIIGLCAVSEGSYYRMFWENRRSLLGALLRRPRMFFRLLEFRRLSGVFRSQLTAGAIPDRPPRAGYIAFLGVAAQARATGAGVILLHDAAGECRKRGWQEMVTAVHRNNPAIIRLYRMLGFVDDDALSTGNLVGLRLKYAGPSHAQPATAAGKGRGRISIRPLRAGHLGEVVAMHLRAFPGFFLSHLGPRFLKEFYAAFLVEGEAVALVAEDEEGRICGAVVGSLHPAGFFRRLLVRRWWAFLWASAGIVARKPAVAARLIRAIGYRGEAPPGPSRALLSSIAVDPACQGSGVGKELVKRWLTAVHQRGAGGCYLTTDARRNESVNAFYLKTGWKLESTLVTKEGRAMNRYVFDW